MHGGLVAAERPTDARRIAAGDTLTAKGICIMAKSDRPEGVPALPATQIAPEPTREEMRRHRAAANEAKRKAAEESAGIYRVLLKVGDDVLKWEGPARDSDEAWSKFNDSYKTSHGPKTPGRSVEKLEKTAA